ncbi:unnamed protein product [Sphagnum jensenii]|uniref:Uncharacterized protein n=1 Tax=Sphagnum jensenii TaxID=128206 RepID=A0ABP0W1P4_9BRYO
MDALPAQPAIDRERLTLGVCMLDNRSGIFQLVSPTGQVYKPDRVLLDSGAQPLMLGKAACIGLGIRRSELELCPFQIQTSLGGATDRSNFMTRERLLVQMKPDHVTDSSRLGVTAVVTAAESYDVLVGGAMLYPMGFQMDYWTETMTYRPGWQFGDGRMSQVHGNILAIDTPVYEDIEEVSSFVATMSSSLDVPLWRSSGVLRQDADRLVSQAWREAFVHVVKVVDRSPMAVVNRVGQPRMALPTFVSFPASHAYREGGPGLVWDTCLQQLVEPNADERERAMGFPTGMTFVPSIFEASRRQVLGQAMDLNCLTWIVSLGMAEQRRLRATFVIVTPLVSSLPTVTVEASTGGEESYTFHPWSTWDVLGEHVKVVAHAVGGVCCSSGVPLGDLEERVASPKVFA